MYNEEVLAEDKEQAIKDALIQMKDDEEGLAILQEVLGTDAMIATNSQDHLGTYTWNLHKIWQCI